MTEIEDAARANSPDARADHLLDQMSLDEQIGLLHGHMPRLMRDKPEHVQIAAGWVPGLVLYLVANEGTTEHNKNNIDKAFNN